MLQRRKNLRLRKVGLPPKRHTKMGQPHKLARPFGERKLQLLPLVRQFGTPVGGTRERLLAVLTPLVPVRMLLSQTTLRPPVPLSLPELHLQGHTLLAALLRPVLLPATTLLAPTRLLRRSLSSEPQRPHLGKKCVCALFLLEHQVTIRLLLWVLLVPLLALLLRVKPVHLLQSLHRGRLLFRLTRLTTRLRVVYRLSTTVTLSLTRLLLVVVLLALGLLLLRLPLFAP